jgi:hypothetical protein
MTRPNFAIGASAVVLLCACVTNGSSSVPSVAGLALTRGSLPTDASPGAAKAAARLYVSDPIGNAVDVYRVTGHHQQPIATITKGIDGPAGLAADAAGNVYVANTLSNTVTEYQRNGSGPVTTYSQDVLGPVDVAVDGNGTVYVANFYSFRDSVVEFPKGSTSPSLVIRNPCSCYPLAVTLDAHDNLYVTYQTLSVVPEVYAYAPGSAKGDERDLQFGSSSTERFFAAGLLFDKAANLLVAAGSLPGIQVFPPGKDDPSKVFGKQGSPQLLQFASSQRDVFVSDTAHHAIEEYTYPEGRLVNTITSGLRSAYGVAVSPPSAP